MRKRIALLATCLGVSVATQTAVDASSMSSVHAGHVVLLHGLARSADSMSKMSDALRMQGYDVCNVDYPSREYPIDVLAAEHVVPAINRCFPESDGPVNFVTHSLGGIVLRQLVATGAVPNVGRVVMLSPPNHGSEVVDKLRNWPLFDWLNGPAGKDLGTDAGASPTKLGPATFDVGIITGARTINPLLSLLIPGNDDGKVSIENAKLEGMHDFLVVRCSHTFIMKGDHAIAQTIEYLAHGTFQHQPNDEPLDCWD